jgi:rifampicin phosphotransferase
MSSLIMPDEGTVPAAVLGLDDPASRSVSVAGAKAAALARAKAAGLPVLDGFVVSVAAAAAIGAGSLPEALVDDLRAAWRRVAPAGRPVIVRSSSPNEDTETSSMAGQFRSVLDVSGWDRLVAATREVVASAEGGPMAVLVQPLLEPAWGGVMFGADPVTGLSDRLVVSAVPGGPDRLVSGAVSGTQMALSPRGRLLDGSDGSDGSGGSRLDPSLRSRSTRRALVRLARRAAELFGGPQDIEWALGHDGELVLLQARPITTLGHEVRASGPTLGPGPVAETFPAPLSRLEEDLWIPPLRDGLRSAIELTGAVSRRRLRSSPVVVTVHGRPAVDLDLFGLTPRKRSVLRALDPRPPARRLRAAWLVGRLRAGLPGLATDVLRAVDAQLRDVPPLDDLSPAELFDLLERSYDVLVSLHGHEVLAGQLLDTGTDSAPRTAASDALRLLARLRADEPDADDDDLAARYPVLLSLVPPAVGPGVTLPPVPDLGLELVGRAGGARSGAAGRSGRPSVDPDGDEAATVREALRLRARWVHELTARAAYELGVELVRRGVLERAEDVRHLDLDALHDALSGRRVEAAAEPNAAATPLPAAFRLAGDDVVVPVTTPGDGTHGQGAGGGRGCGPVHPLDPLGDGGLPPDGAVLVVPTLDPGLAPLLPRLGGLVAETGSVLSHLAILAREHGVPTVVALPGAVGKYPDGTWLLVDGTTGEVAPAGNEEWRAA